jgi:hypothetical protein
VIIDCHFFFPTFISALEAGLKEIRFSHPIKYAEAMALVEAVKLFLKRTGSNFCDFAFDLNGILKD